MSKDLLTKEDLVKGVILKTLTPIFLMDEKLKETSIDIHKARLIIARKILTHEYSVATPKENGSVEMGLNTAGGVLLDYIVREYKEDGYGYVTKAVQNPAAQAQLRKLSEIESDGIVIPPLYSMDYFKKIPIKIGSGPIEFDLSDRSGASDDTFIERLNIFHHWNKFKVILTDILGADAKSVKLADSADSQVKLNIDKKDITISAQEYDQFNICDFLGKKEEILKKIMQEQFEYLGQYLENFKNEKTVSMISSLRNLWKSFDGTSPDVYKRISIWYFFLIHIHSDLEVNATTINQSAKMDLEKFILVLTPGGSRDLVFPSQHTSSVINQYFDLNLALKRLYGANLFKEDYTFYRKRICHKSPDEQRESRKALLVEKIKVLGKELKEAKTWEARNAVLEKKLIHEESLYSFELAPMLDKWPDDQQKYMKDNHLQIFRYQWYSERIIELDAAVKKSPKDKILKSEKTKFLTKLEKCQAQMSALNKIIALLNKKSVIEIELKKTDTALQAKLGKELVEINANIQEQRKIVYPESLYGPGSPFLLVGRESRLVSLPASAGVVHAP